MITHTAIARRFTAIWNRIHAKRGYVETDEVWLHVFERETPERQP